MHAEIREAASKLITLAELRHINFSRFEPDECGSLNEWPAAAPKDNLELARNDNQESTLSRSTIQRDVPSTGKPTVVC